MPEPAAGAIDAFIDRWKDSGGHDQCGGDLRSPTPAEETRNLPGTDKASSKATVQNQQLVRRSLGEVGSTIIDRIPWPKGLDAQFAEIRKLLPATGPDAPAIAAFFGKKTKARINQIEDILKTLRSLGMLE